MLKETETEETIGFFAAVLSQITFQLRRDSRASWLCLWPVVPAPSFKFNDLFNEHFTSIFFSKVFCRVKTGEV